ncbi:hypothetical protein HN512_01690 [Candidatus Peregrinibacteria bacterium]|jgi:hypothetical protein|nr:hypothetical protein [Candidatus Peregrinibacteria bacterium]MBT3598526.1 hypothetical protein [Candidatus Peregrinibacteria bacterium]MBT4586078.1 hypothetical protein [Candidatus Peregrinibacteria bacterium]MBT6730348.1 hypothetical protein [Candidatus Peregrinibacteria bacterium]MBT7009022.1 hypothetical protein [Candidatus Peregrinibacteria bacterium]
MERKENPIVVGAFIALAGSVFGAGAVLTASLALGSTYPSWIQPSTETRYENQHQYGDVIRRNEGVIPIREYDANEHDSIHNSAPVNTPSDLKTECMELREGSIRYWRCLAEARDGNYYQPRQTR